MFPFKLGRIQQFDSRSLNFPVKDILTTTQVNTYRTANWNVTIELDQGQTPSCVGHGHAHFLATEPLVEENVTEDKALMIYRTAQSLDGISGIHEGSTVIAGAKAVQQLWPEVYKIYSWCLGLADVLSTLSHLGPVVLGINWTDSMFTPNAKGFIVPTGSFIGGHCLEAIGIDVPNQYVILHNSWSKTWGLNGNCKISWKDLDYLLRQGGEALYPVKGKSIPL